jgi:simple sugar transport system permease protein
VNVLRRIGLALLAPASALVFAMAVSAIALRVSGNDPWSTFSTMWEYGTRYRTLITTINQAVPLYLSAVAVAVGFKMGLFNIGVDGQYRLAAVFSAAAGAAVSLPAFLHVPFIIIIAMVTGAAWAGVAGVLKATRGVHEVISTIMLNAIATSIAAYLLANYFKAKGGALNIGTKEIPSSGWIPSLNRLVGGIFGDVPTGAHLQGFLVGAVLVGGVYYVIVWRTRFGFDLRASGLNPWAAQSSGVDAKGMIVKTMLLSGAIAGLVYLPELLGFAHRYSLDFTTGLGFAGIAVALLGRNHPFGMAAAALLFAFLSSSAQILDLKDVPKEIVGIMQGVILLSVVVAYEVVRRVRAAGEVRAAAEHDERPSAVAA